MTHLPCIAILGAGCIGNYLAGCLLPLYKTNPNKLTLIGRLKIQSTIHKHGLTASDFNGNHYLTKNNIHVLTQEDTQQLNRSDIDIIIVTVKCTAIDSTINNLHSLLSPSTIVVLLQNGIGSELVIKKAFPHHIIIRGIVGFNVVEQRAGHYHKATDGDIIFEQLTSTTLKTRSHIQAAAHSIGQLINLLNQQQIVAKQVNNFEQFQWGKLLLNLNNSINALTGIPLKQQLSQRSYRIVLANAIRETLTVLKSAHISPEQLTSAPTWLLPIILTLPNVVFNLIANSMLAIDPHARSSMWDDLNNNKVTEIDFINGAVIRLGEKNGIKTPINSALVQAIKQAESCQQGSPSLTAKQLAQIGLLKN